MGERGGGLKGSPGLTVGCSSYFRDREFLSEARAPQGAEGMFIIPERTVIEACGAKRSPGFWGFPLKVAFTFLRTFLFETCVSELKRFVRWETLSEGRPVCCWGW